MNNSSPATLIRAESVAEYPAIAAVHVRAFNRTGEAMIVALQRHNAAFDPELSLVAEREGRIIGHALFLPHTVRLSGEDVHAVNLAPIAVDPTAQGQGVGGRLIKAGHAIAQEKGYAFCFLLGHTSYYPRFGYRTHAFGDSWISLPAPDPPDVSLAHRCPTEADLPALHALWLHEEGAVDMTIPPGPDLIDWLSPNPHIATHIWIQNNAIVGYTRVGAAEPDRPRMFLACDHAAARTIAGTLAHAAGVPELHLPLHPMSASAGAFGQPNVSAWNAAMACSLLPSPFDNYYAQIQTGRRAAGRLIWPAAFDLA